jgi:hypothetical protein
MHYSFSWISFDGGYYLTPAFTVLITQTQTNVHAFTDGRDVSQIRCVLHLFRKLHRYW